MCVLVQRYVVACFSLLFFNKGEKLPFNYVSIFNVPNPHSFRFLIAVYCDITVWYMTSVMGTKRSIYLFTPERQRDLSARAPGPAFQEHYNIITRPQICLFKNFARRSEHLRAYLKRSTTVKRVLCAFRSLRVGELSGFLNPHYLRALRNSLAYFHFARSGWCPHVL